MILLLTLFSCGGETTPPDRDPSTDGPAVVDEPGTTPDPTDTVEPAAPETCDAGDEAWVQRVFPLVLGRRAEGAAEVRMWTEMVRLRGRAETVRALSRDGAYQKHWKEFLQDTLKVARSGADVDADCWDNGDLAVHDGSLAEFVRDNASDAAAFGPAWNMADLTIDALVLDDMSVLYRANVFARTNYVPYCGNNTGPEQIEGERRVALGDDFLSTYTNRNLTCISCHNSEYSVTDDPDPKLDRTWGEPALFEKALFGDSWGPGDVDGFYSAFKYEGVIDDPFNFGGGGAGLQYNAKPWGWAQSCGEFRREPPEYDFLGVDSGYFLGEVDAATSLWELEGSLQAGIDDLGEHGLTVAADGTVAPEQALAWLTAKNLVDQVWTVAFGRALTLPYGFSRNQAQAERLTALTEQFTETGWSLRELLVAIAMDPYFNAGLPTTCGGPAYGMQPVVDPYSADDPNPEIQGNGPGDIVHRHRARTLLQSANHALGWPDPVEFFNSGFGFGSEEEDLQESVGVFLSSAQAGFNGSDFQGLLAWESTYGLCRDPAVRNDMVTQVITAGTAQGATVEDAALAIKDRLIGRASWDDAGEITDVEALLGTPLSTPMASLAVDSPVPRNLRLFCGLLTVSPEFQLAGEPVPVGPIPKIDLGAGLACDRLVELWDRQGVAVSCVYGMPVE